MIAGARFVDTSAGALQPCPAAFFCDLEIQLQALDRRHVVRIVVNTGEALADGTGGLHGSGRSSLCRGEYVLQLHVGKASNSDVALHRIGRLFAVLVHPMQRVIDGGGHCDRTQPRIVENFIMKNLVAGSAVNGQRHRNHVRLLAEFAENSGVPVLHERSHGFCSIYDLKSIQRRGKRGQHLRLGHGQVHHPELHQRMAASQQVSGVNVGNGAGGGNVHVAAHQYGADGGARFQRLRLLDVAGRSHAHYRDNSLAGKLRSELLNRVLGKSTED